jgi:hypothetical protein
MAAPVEILYFLTLFSIKNKQISAEPSLVKEISKEPQDLIN